MADTNIEWTDKTWNPVVGCTKVSQGCKHCYAKTLHDQRHKAFQEHGGVFPANLQLMPSQYAVPFETVQLMNSRLEDPLRWRKPQRVFVNSVSDLFHQEVPFEFIHKVFCVMLNAPRHTFQILTKRPERMLEFMRWELARAEQEADFVLLPLPNVWLGTSVENQEAADKRIPHLLETPAAVRFLSCEPLLGPVDLEPYLWEEAGPAWAGRNPSPDLHWVIVGGESGKGARPMHPDWARAIRDQCQDAEVAFFFKQSGEWAEPFVNGELRTEGNAQQGVVWEDDHWEFFNRGERHGDLFRVGKKAAGRLLDGVEHSAFPEAKQ